MNVHEEFIGLYEVASIQADMLIAVIKDCLLRLNLSLNKVRGQCYDGASNMSGIRNGVAKKIRDDEPRAIYTHCYGHSLNLAVGDTIKNSSIMKNSLNTVHEITKLVKYSPRRESLFNAIKDDMSPGNIGIRTLCPTRWTVRADSMQSIIKNYSVLQELWDQAISVTRDTETISRIRGTSSSDSLLVSNILFILGYVFPDPENSPGSFLFTDDEGTTNTTGLFFPFVLFCFSAFFFAIASFLASLLANFIFFFSSHPFFLAFSFV